MADCVFSYYLKIDFSKIENGTLMNRFSNVELLDDKDLMYWTIIEFDKNKKNRFKFDSRYVLPETFVIDNFPNSISSEEQRFLKLNLTGMWISKKASGLLGYGIKVIPELNMNSKLEVI